MSHNIQADVECLNSLNTSYPQLAAVSADEQALAYQFLEWKVIKFDPSSASGHVWSALKEYNEMLSSRTYLASNRIANIDILLGRALFPFIEKLNSQEKEQVGNLLRWYTLIASNSSSNLPTIPFQRLPMY
ncbi:Eukaryotic translation elongation factor 1 epsilon-1 [Clonorchis sinensis]|uniref:Eukaryotic translation elongation factor 1 epsilon-1 n=1 Tax=Clonorchis sinensis TaxID=79923 RepID=A0A8T1MHS4_CLOSI|nr:Eukaryotic translation elongation factor 1 epsilon-1 [Clonorchis sinensis]